MYCWYAARGCPHIETPQTVASCARCMLGAGGEEGLPGLALLVPGPGPRGNLLQGTKLSGMTPRKVPGYQPETQRYFKTLLILFPFQVSPNPSLADPLIES